MERERNNNKTKNNVNEPKDCGMGDNVYHCGINEGKQNYVVVSLVLIMVKLLSQRMWKQRQIKKKGHTFSKSNDSL